MNSEKKPKIEAIYPLTAMQQGLLFHHLTAKKDQGLLQVQCILKGDLDVEKLKLSWDKTVEKHEFLRGSVHWKKIEKPLILIRPNKSVDWTIEDWFAGSTSTPPNSFDNRLNEFKEKDIEQGVDLEKNPLLQLSLIRKDLDTYYLIWKCHHIALDGWSSSIVINDVFKYYNTFYTENNVEVEKLPNHKHYLNWQKQINSAPAESFWKSSFEGFEKPSFFNQGTESSTLGSLTKSQKTLSLEKTAELKLLAQQYKVTLNTLFQGIWSTVLHKYFNSDDISFGNTVSGRSGGFKNIESVLGMFANVLPVRSRHIKDQSFSDLLQKIQIQQQEARNFEHFSIEKINSWINVEEPAELFDSLFIFENFPWKPIKSGNVEVTSFEGGITTTYPVNFIVKILDTISYEIIVDKKIITNELFQWLVNSIEILISELLSNKDVTVPELTNQLNKPNSAQKEEIVRNTISKSIEKEQNYSAPKNTIELTLTKIWEELFKINHISVNDNFFELGGKSLLAVRMFSIITEKLNIKLPPTTLLEHPTIQSIAQLVLESDDKKENLQTNWKFIIPLKTSGKATPLFCIHAGGGHVFFYKHLADKINSEIPIYALQPTGIFGKEKPHQSIEEMSKEYADEIIKIQPQGTLNVMVYCFSTGVGVEIASYLKTKGRNVNIIVADTIAEHRLLLDRSRLSIRLSAFVKRLISNPFKALNEMIGYRIYFYLKPIAINLFGSNEEKNTEKMRLHLVRLFNKYQWKTKVDQVSLVLTKKIDDRYNKAILKSWKGVINGDKKISHIEIEAKHATMFDELDVAKTAKAIEKSIRN